MALDILTKAAVDMIEAGFRRFIAMAVALAVSVVIIVLVVAKLVFNASGDSPTSNIKPVAATPAVQAEQRQVSGLCFQTPMGDVGKVIAQDGDLVEMTFRGGVKSSYWLNQVSEANCDVLPPK